MSNVRSEVEGREDEEEPEKKIYDPDEDDKCIAIRESSSKEEESITIGQLFQNTVKRFPNHPALRYKMGKKWNSITFTGYYHLCIKAAKSFLKVRSRVHGTTCICVPHLVFW